MEMREIMSKIAILTDSSCDIPQEMAEKYGIDIMSFHILLDDVDYIERESCTNTEFYDKMRAAKGVPSTAAITPSSSVKNTASTWMRAIPMSSMFPSTNPALPPITTHSWRRGCCGKSARSTT